MKIPTRPNTDTKQTSQEKLDERESWHKLVVKVILWADDANNSLVETLDDEGSSPSNKLTHSEWNTYCKRMIKININQEKAKVLSDLNFTLEQIKSHSGFDESKK